VDSIKIDRREKVWDGMDWIDLAEDRDQWRALVNTVMNLLRSVYRLVADKVIPDLHKLNDSVSVFYARIQMIAND
jgi:hypothetical protein